MIRSLYRAQDGGLRADLKPDEFAMALQDAGGLLWVDLAAEPSEACAPILRETFGFHPLAVPLIAAGPRPLVAIPVADTQAKHAAGDGNGVCSTAIDWSKVSQTANRIKQIQPVSLRLSSLLWHPLDRVESDEARQVRLIGDVSQ